MNDFDIMFQARQKTIPGLHHVMNVMHHIIGFELTSIVKLLVYKVDSMIRVTHLSCPTPTRYLTTSFIRDK